MDLINNLALGLETAVTFQNLFYALNERDDRNTDSPYLNDFAVPIQGTINDTSFWDLHHPHSDDRY